MLIVRPSSGGRKHTTLLFGLVGDEVSGWNPFLTSLVQLAEKLEGLGIVYAEGQATYIESEGIHHAQFNQKTS
jgi:hypothetical protein